MGILTLEGHLRYPNIRREFGQLGSQAHDTLYLANSIHLTGFIWLQINWLVSIWLQIHWLFSIWLHTVWRIGYALNYKV